MATKEQRALIGQVYPLLQHYTTGLITLGLGAVDLTQEQQKAILLSLVLIHRNLGSALHHLTKAFGHELQDLDKQGRDLVTQVQQQALAEANKAEINGDQSQGVIIRP